VLAVARYLRWGPDELDAAVAAEVDRIAADLLATEEDAGALDGGWQRFELAPAAPPTSIEALRAALADDLLHRGSTPIGRDTLTRLAALDGVSGLTASQGTRPEAGGSRLAIPATSPAGHVARSETDGGAAGPAAAAEGESAVPHSRYALTYEPAVTSPARTGGAASEHAPAVLGPMHDAVPTPAAPASPTDEGNGLTTTADAGDWAAVGMESSRIVSSPTEPSAPAPLNASPLRMPFRRHPVASEAAPPWPAPAGQAGWPLVGAPSDGRALPAEGAPSAVGALGPEWALPPAGAERVAGPLRTRPATPALPDLLDAVAEALESEADLRGLER
jgi:hypothetical protein